MDQIQHKYIKVQGLNLHVAEIGTGSSAVVFIHGFPEIWYSWRHQMLAVANAGYHAIAPDLRGYGLSEHHRGPEKASFNDFVEDTICILEYFQIEKEPGRAETDFGRFDVKTVWRNIYILFSRSEIPIAEKDKEIMDLVDPSTPLPPWLSNEDLAVYTTSYEKSGFDSPMQVPYKGLQEDFDMDDPKVEVPVLLIMGGKDYFLKFPGIEDYITSGKVKDYVSNLDMKTLQDGTHFIQEQFPDQVNQLIINFLEKHSC
ncbi:hypothetical protein GH714_017419 [Hevea brasiliensis]|uniref:AB hydrolase-1 domain-containing protein n=1 Tax=Hevea brasiliensis TaxID=3981 RepID=A0A6A6LSB3_HEVBR|nr:hypothetical protein GH714_017419 [Hevea brasiliensis]